MIYTKDGKILVSADDKLCSTCCSTICTVCWPDGIRLTFSDVTMCGDPWVPPPGGMNRSFDLAYQRETDTYCYYNYAEEDWCFEVRIRKSDCYISFFVACYILGAWCLFFYLGSGYYWDDGGGNSGLSIEMCDEYSTAYGLGDCVTYTYQAAYGGSVSWEKL